MGNSLSYRIERIAFDDTKDLRDKPLLVDKLGLEEAIYNLPENNSFCIAIRGVTLKIISYPLVVD